MHMTDNQTDEQFLLTYNPDDYPHPSLAVDVVILTIGPGGLSALLTRRDEFPQKNHWSLPGGFVALDEEIPACVARILTTKVSLSDVYVEQLYTFGDLTRDPRTRVISLAHLALVPYTQLRDLVDNDPKNLKIAPLILGPHNTLTATNENGTALAVAFDHRDILALAISRLRGKLDYVPVGFEFLPERFTLRQLQTIHEAILSQPLNKDSFRRRMVASGWIKATGKFSTGSPYRPAELYELSKKRTAKSTPAWDPATDSDWTKAFKTLITPVSTTP
jgi:8-oxo-dGTP diphosphatase